MKFFVPVKFKRFYKEYKEKSFTLLDIGCGNHGPSETIKWFPGCRYFGVDKEIYNNTSADMTAMEKFYMIDLQKQSLEAVPDCFFDVIIASHIIEHLTNGADILRELVGKAKHGGKIYIEYPSVRTLRFPRSKGSLHFCDDSSHVRLYDLKEICNILLSGRCKIIKAGVRRDLFAVLLLPLVLVVKIIRREPVTGFGLWDLLGFAEFVYAEKID